jgi:hypothetical protein
VCVCQSSAAHARTPNDKVEVFCVFLIFYKAMWIECLFFRVMTPRRVVCGAVTVCCGADCSCLWCSDGLLWCRLQLFVVQTAAVCGAVAVCCGADCSCLSPHSPFGLFKQHNAVCCQPAMWHCQHKKRSEGSNLGHSTQTAVSRKRELTVLGCCLV